MLSEHTPFLFIVSAPSGCGKSTLIGEVFKRVEGLAISVSYTTREPRAGEINGSDYNFVAPDCFSRMKMDCQFVESAFVHGNFYGTSCSSISRILDDGLDVVLDIDVQGMREVKLNSNFDIVTVFILPPSMNELESRLRKRQTDADEVILQRLDNAATEIAECFLYDFVIINDCLNDACEKLVAILLSERSRSSRTQLCEPCTL